MPRIEPIVQFDAHQQYACQDCPAKCCRFPWKIAVTPEEYQRYHNTPWISERLKAHNIDLINDGSDYRMPRVLQPDGGYGCVFLDEENRCTIQLQEGHNFIPRTCRDYPFLFVKDDSPEIADAPIRFTFHSYFCKSIQQNYGEPLDRLITQKLSDIEETRPLAQLPDQLPLGFKTLDKPTYTAFLEKTASFFENPALTAAEAILAGRQLISHLLLANENPISPPLIAGYTPDVSSLKNTAAPPNTLTGRVLIATFNHPVFPDKRLVTHPPLPGVTKYWLGIQNLWRLLGLIQQQGSGELWNKTHAIEFSAAKALPVPVHQPEFQQALKRYYRQLLRNRSFAIQQSDLLRAFFTLAISYPSMLRHAKYVALSNHHEQVTLDDFNEALGNMDAVISSSNRLQKSIIDTAHETIFTLLSSLGEGTFERVLYCEKQQRTQ